VATQALKLLLNRGDVPHAPIHLHFDAYRGLVVRTRLHWGNAGPVQQLKLVSGRKIYGLMARRWIPVPEITRTDSRLSASLLLAILDLARWTPSGDNEQPWRFELLDAETVVIHLASGVGTNPYEYRGGEPTLLAGGMLLESIKVAASQHGRSIRWTVAPGGPPWLSRVHLIVDNDVEPNPLAAALPMRSVVRSGFGMRPLTVVQKTALQDALGKELNVSWYEQTRDRLSLARLGAMATSIRLCLPEAFAIHQRVVDWERDRSPDKIPARALGLNRPTLMLMRWAMQRWSRMKQLNAVFGSGAVALQLDLWPALSSAAFFVIRTNSTKDATDDGASRTATLLRTGERLQRFWLTATKLGLAVQPAMATLIFADYGANSICFTEDRRALMKAKVLAERAETALGPLRPIQFLGRIGERRDGPPGPRSVRRPIDELMLKPPLISKS
jgi:sulfur-carrier protein adenylyltransferase/sulfurtransferase